MRYPLRFAATLALAVLLATPALSQQVRTVDDDGWCDNDWGRGDEHHCLVLETTMQSDGIRIDDLTNGGVEVKAWDGDDIRIRARVVGRADESSRARELAESVRLRIDGNDIETDGARTGRDESWFVSYRIDVPRETDLDLETTNGGIHIEGVHGQLRFHTSNGGVTLIGVGGDVEGRTSNGGVRVDLTGSTWEGRGLDVSTSNGGVRIRVPDSYNAVLETGTTNGGIDVDFPVQMTRHSRRQMTLELGNGGPELRVTTTNGGVRIGRI